MQFCEPEQKPKLNRIHKAPNLLQQVEAILREAILQRRFTGNRLPPEVQLAEQLGVSRETVRRAAESLQQQGLLVKYRRKGTFLTPPPLAMPNAQLCLGYFQISYGVGRHHEEAVCRAIDGLILHGAADEASRQDALLMVQHLPSSGGRKVLLRTAQRTRLDGLILVSCGDEKLIRSSLGLGVPVVLVDHDCSIQGVSTVRDDSFQGAVLAMSHLIQLGHCAIGLIHWRHADLNPWRLQGYREAMREAHLRRRRHWEIFVELNEAGAQAAVRQLLALKPRPTALYCFNNTLARLIMDELHVRKVRVPEDVSVIGGGGEDVPGLTCTVCDWHALGRVAVELLSAQLRHKDCPPQHRLLPHSLRIGKTTCPPA